MLDFLGWLATAILSAVVIYGLILLFRGIREFVSKKKIKNKRDKVIEDKSNKIRIDKVAISKNIIYKLPQAIYIKEENVDELDFDKLLSIIILELLGCKRENE